MEMQKEATTGAGDDEVQDRCACRGRKRPAVLLHCYVNIDCLDAVLRNDALDEPGVSRAGPVLPVLAFSLSEL